jgi:hypothetical protein
MARHLVPEKVGSNHVDGVKLRTAVKSPGSRERYEPDSGSLSIEYAQDGSLDPIEVVGRRHEVLVRANLGGARDWHGRRHRRGEYDGGDREGVAQRCKQAPHRADNYNPELALTSRLSGCQRPGCRGL